MHENDRFTRNICMSDEALGWFFETDRVIAIDLKTNLVYFVNNHCAETARADTKNGTATTPWVRIVTVTLLKRGRRIKYLQNVDFPSRRDDAAATVRATRGVSTDVPRTDSRKCLWPPSPPFACTWFRPRRAAAGTLGGWYANIGEYRIMKLKD